MASPFKATPGPDVAVIPNAPPKEAPMAAETAAISSSAWKDRTPKFLVLLTHVKYRRLE